MKILRPFATTGAVFFPEGKLPDGTCEFATKECSKGCYIKEDYEYDEEISIPMVDKKAIHGSFMIRLTSTTCYEIRLGLDELQTSILHWFGSGDCKTKDMDKIIEIIEALKSGWFGDITQMGFTRNVKLWEMYKDIFVLSVDDKKDIAGRTGMFAIADYEERITRLYNPLYKVRSDLCGPYSCRDSEDASMERAINCKACQRLKLCCFDRR